MLFPAGDPGLAVLSGHGLRLRLERGAAVAPGALRLLCRDPGARSARTAGATRIEDSLKGQAGRGCKRLRACPNLLRRWKFARNRDSSKTSAFSCLLPAKSFDRFPDGCPAWSGPNLCGFIVLSLHAPAANFTPLTSTSVLTIRGKPSNADGQ
jgi:hypothetical protein